MSQPAQDDAKSGEEETYATNLWQDLQQSIEQDCLTEGQEQIETMCLPSQNGIAEYQIRQIERAVETICTQSQIGFIETQAAEDFRLRRHLSEAVSEQRTAIANVVIQNVVESFILPGADITAAAYSNQEEGGQDDPDIPDQEAGSSELSYIDYEELPELMDEIAEEVMEEIILKQNLNFGFDYSRAPNGPRKEYNYLDSSEVQTQAAGDVQHRQEQEAKDYAASESNETEEEQDHNYRHGAEYWQSVD